MMTIAHIRSGGTYNCEYFETNQKTVQADVLLAVLEEVGASNAFGQRRKARKHSGRVIVRVDDHLLVLEDAHNLPEPADEVNLHQW
jgi:Rad3-related DNA helicase